MSLWNATTARKFNAEFLKRNGEQDRVVKLRSGLQYKVLREGSGVSHPKINSPCECHYSGTLIDGTEFDSSYKRGAPTTFAPNQVIKGWTEAMQMMREGDKWELTIPMELAYGPEGRPPKIPPAATLVFVMEMIRIKGPSVPMSSKGRPASKEGHKQKKGKDNAKDKKDKKNSKAKGKTRKKSKKDKKKKKKHNQSSSSSSPASSSSSDSATSSSHKKVKKRSRH